MDLKITEKKDEPLLSRIKLTAEINFETATPSYEEVKKKLASALNNDEKLIVIKNIYTKFGIKKADLFAYIYNNKEAMEKIEPKQKEKKKAKVEKPVKKPERAKEKTEEKKETKEEKKTEEPKEKPKEEKKTPKKKEAPVKKEEKNN